MTVLAVANVAATLALVAVLTALAVRGAHRTVEGRAATALAGATLFLAVAALTRRAGWEHQEQAVTLAWVTITAACIAVLSISTTDQE